jgi:hypothetical protein
MRKIKRCLTEIAFSDGKMIMMMMIIIHRWITRCTVQLKVKIMLDETVAPDGISYTNFGLSVRSRIHVAVSWTCHQLAGAANTQNHENAGNQDTTISWQVMHIH